MSLPRVSPLCRLKRSLRRSRKRCKVRPSTNMSRKVRHGLTGSPTWITWREMRTRCLNKHSKDYPYYGGRGITIDPAWDRFEDFLADMGLRPSLAHTLDRRHNNGAYTKANCRWATRLTQSRNRPAYNKLTKALADQIRLDYSAGNTTHVKLATKYGVTATHIGDVINWKRWR